MTQTRRAVLLAPLGLALASCAGQSGPQLLSTVAADAKLVADALSAALPNLTTILSGATLTRIEGYIASAVSVAGSLASAPVATGQSLAATFVSTVSSVLSALGTVALPGKLSGILADIQILLPIIQIAAGILLPMAGVPEPGRVEAARLNLRAYAVGR